MAAAAQMTAAGMFGLAPAPAVAPPEGKKKGPKGIKGPNVRWNVDKERILLETLADERVDGKASDNGFKPASFTLAAQMINNAFPKETPQQTKETATTKYKAQRKLKADFGNMTFLRNLSGGGYDSATGSILADKHTWDELVVKKPALAKFREKALHLVLPHAALMEQVFAGTMATGKHARNGGPPQDSDSRSDEEVGGSGSGSGSGSGLTPCVGHMADVDDDDDDDDAALEQLRAFNVPGVPSSAADQENDRLVGGVDGGREASRKKQKGSAAAMSARALATSAAGNRQQ
ncbi:hypothetical protein HK101_007162, partial [Irineochytrium annulatum]